MSQNQKLLTLKNFPKHVPIDLNNGGDAQIKFKVQHKEVKNNYYGMILKSLTKNKSNI